MAIVRVVLQILLRTAVLALGLIAYDRGYDQVVTPTPGDADIGKGLLAFLLVTVVSLSWAFVDGLRHRPLVWVVVWLVTAVAVGVGWEYGAGLLDDSREGVALELVTFTSQLVLFPALLGAGFAWLISRRREPPPQRAAE